MPYLKNNILSDKEIKNFYDDSKNGHRGSHKNWCTFTNQEMYAAMSTIMNLKAEIEKLKKLNKMYFY
jgi:hypothetical protein